MNIRSLNALTEALKTGAPIQSVLISDARKDRKTAMIRDLCKKQRVPVRSVPPQTLTRKAGPDHQGVFAEIAPVKFQPLEKILKEAKTGLMVILDGITDTGNMGAVIRSAVAADVDGIIIPQHNAAPINETVLKTSAGAVLKAKLVQPGNLVNAVKELKKQGFWIVGADSRGEIPYYDYDFTYKTAIIMGSEDKGISPLLKKNADHILSIPHSPLVESLNVSAAASVMLFEALRQQRKS